MPKLDSITITPHDLAQMMYQLQEKNLSHNTAIRITDTGKEYSVRDSGDFLIGTIAKTSNQQPHESNS